jgi:hypothetical protein
VKAGMRPRRSRAPIPRVDFSTEVLAAVDGPPPAAEDAGCSSDPTERTVQGRLLAETSCPNPESGPSASNRRSPGELLGEAIVQSDSLLELLAQITLEIAIRSRATAPGVDRNPESELPLARTCGVRAGGKCRVARPRTSEAGGSKAPEFDDRTYSR